VSRFRLIEAEKAGHSVVRMCRLLGVSPSGYYAWRKRPPSARARADAALTTTIRAIHANSRGTYGAPRVHAELGDAHGVRCGRKRVARLMRTDGLAGACRRRSVRTTRRDTAASVSDDLVKRAFTAPAPDRLWLADITYLPTWQGFLYLAVVLDACTRRVVGWSMADHLRAELVVDALQMALWQRRPTAGAIHHSDHGSQYTSWAFGQRLREAGLLGSMGSIGDCFDNGLAESFFATLQTELLDRHTWTTREQLANAVFAYLEGFYNPRRRHSALNYLSPADYETDWHRQQHKTAA
jgi:putative transposase